MVSPCFSTFPAVFCSQYKADGTGFSGAAHRPAWPAAMLPNNHKCSGDAGKPKSGAPSRPWRGSKTHTDVQDYVQSCEHTTRWPRPQPASQHTRSSQDKKQQHLRASTEAYHNSFATSTIPTWNKLPTHVAETDSVKAFKSQLAAQATP